MGERAAKMASGMAAKQAVQAAVRVTPMQARAGDGAPALQSMLGNRALGRLLAGSPAASGRLIQRSCTACHEWEPPGSHAGCTAVLQRKCSACESEAQDRSHVQAKLVIGAPGDRYEQEADLVADLVVRAQTTHAPAPMATTPPMISPYVQREPVGDDQAQPGTFADPTLETRLLGAAGAGRPLPPRVQQGMEQRFGIRFDGVRVHHDAEAHRLAEDVEALAFTHGRNIYFAAGAYAPDTPAGDRLLAHELTHVVQQSGGAASPSHQAPVQRIPLIRGTEFHKVVGRLLTANKERGLVSEAPIPGATRNKQELDLVGYADLYESTEKNKALGVRGRFEVPPGVNPSDVPDKPLKFERVSGRKAKVAGGGKPEFSPRPQGETKPFSAEFPEKVMVGDIKAIWMIGGKAIVEKPGEGVVQVSSYGAGLKRFVAAAAAQKKVVRSSIATDIIEKLTIPPELDYRNFEKEKASPSKGAIIIDVSKDGPQRYWMYEVPKTGLFYYFHLAHPHPSDVGRAKLEDAFVKLEPIKQDLRKPDGGIDSTLVLQKTPKWRAAPPPRSVQRNGISGRVKAPPARSDRGQVVQRKKGPRDKRDWPALGKMWEAERVKWDSEYAKPFLRSAEGKALNERVQINDVLGLGNDISQGRVAGAGKHLESVKLWSGVTGKSLGALRFLFGSTFDKVANAFDWLRTKISDFWAKLSGSKSPSVGGGWEQRLLNLLFQAIKLGVRELVSVFFELCVNCLEGLIGKVVCRFTEDISEKLHDEIAEIYKRFTTFEDKFKQEFERRFSSWDVFIADLAKVQQWLDILTTMERLIRLGMQAIACLSPPALGCLWGLVVQVGLDTALSLIIGTDWFQEHVINHPSVRNIIKRFAGPTIRGLLAAALRKVGLADFAKDVAPCNEAGSLESPPLLPIAPVSASELPGRRAEWERANRPKMLQDLQFRMQTRFGVPATEAELEQLVAAIGRSGKSLKQLKEIFNSTPKWSNGKYDLAAIRRRLIGDSDQSGPGRGPALSITKELGRPGGGPVEIGPRTFQPPPGAPLGEQAPTLPGVGLRF